MKLYLGISFKKFKNDLYTTGVTTNIRLIQFWIVLHIRVCTITSPKCDN